MTKNSELYKKLSENEVLAIRYAYLDLVGSYENQMDHDWENHKDTISFFESIFFDILEDIIKE